MADRAVRFRRGTTTQHDTFTGLEAEVTVDTDKNVAVVHDGATAGGFPLALESDQTATQTDLTNHKNNTSNPHSVTKDQVGLGNVTNDAQLKIASNLADLNNATTARSNLDLSLQADGGDIPETGRNNTWTARQTINAGIITVGGTDDSHIHTQVSDDTNTNFFNLTDSGDNAVGQIQAKSLDGVGGGIIDFTGWDDVHIAGSSVHHAGNTTNRIRNLTAGEVQQLEAIGSTTISATQWGYVGGLASAPLEDNDLLANGGEVTTETDLITYCFIFG